MKRFYESACLAAFWILVVKNGLPILLVILKAVVAVMEKFI